jgi:hypothetical protein
VWLYFRFCLSFRELQEVVVERGIDASYGSVLLWTLTFGSEYARRLRRTRDRCGYTWHLDEVFCSINGKLVPATGQHAKRSCLRSNTEGQTTEHRAQNLNIDPLESGSEKCDVSNPFVTPSASSQCTRKSRITSDRGGTSCGRCMI